jgi:hypothetical protein
MGDDVNTDTDEQGVDPMAKAIAGGYREPAPASREDRAKHLVAALDHAIKHNAPVTQTMLAEARDLLGVPLEEPGDPNLPAPAEPLTDPVV